MVKKTTQKKIEETVELESWSCDKCGADITLFPFSSDIARKEQSLRVIVYYGVDVAHTPQVDLIDADFDFCEACVEKAAGNGLDAPTYKEETARYLERIAALLRETDK